MICCCVCFVMFVLFPVCVLQLCVAFDVFVSD